MWRGCYVLSKVVHVDVDYKVVIILWLLRYDAICPTYLMCMYV